MFKGTLMYLVLLFPVYSHAFLCGNSIPDSLSRISLNPSDYPYPVDSLLFVNHENPVFPGIFTLKADWDWETVTDWDESQGWGLEELVTFAECVISTDPDTFPDLANRICAYFAFDTDSSHSGIQIGEDRHFTVLLSRDEAMGKYDQDEPIIAVGLKHRSDGPCQAPETVGGRSRPGCIFSSHPPSLTCRHRR
ncbi:MAG: hypothetical protein QF492_04015 [Candidatus Krumholzibacteria bacterium]|nr:hypothetical protein [Candidatus Krumholzibacteria bacterium]MDP6669062.1 hypothetical protein [Candidatus Krumholzibacteria bacterium]MDP6796210.1 hypothetical protein [Candidatus Krumholzibacteria bacterium]MDP7021465.1 hypothetical protein [Candidatus Krumholzibacteria bacterium]